MRQRRPYGPVRGALSNARPATVSHVPCGDAKSVPIDAKLSSAVWPGLETAAAW